METIQERIEELRSSVNTQSENFSCRLERSLQSIDNPVDLARWIVRYDAFNRGFPGAGLSLAGLIASRPRFFGNLGAEKVAARVLAAISDEFIDRPTGETSLHSQTRRAFGESCVKELLRGTSEEIATVYSEFDNESDINIIRMQDEYGLKAQSSFAGIFRGLGFFTGSETSGSTEFVVLARCLESQWPRLLEGIKGVDDKQGRNVYSWVIDHKDLEADHARFAFSAIETAIDNLTCKERSKEALEYVEGGFESFFFFARKLLVL